VKEGVWIKRRRRQRWKGVTENRLQRGRQLVSLFASAHCSVSATANVKPQVSTLVHVWAVDRVVTANTCLTVRN